MNRTKQIVLILVTCLAIIGLIVACSNSSGSVETQSSNAPPVASEQTGLSCCESAAPSEITKSGCCGGTSTTNLSAPRRLTSGCSCCR